VGLHGKVLVAGRLPKGVASVRSYQKLPLCLTELIPASSRRDPLLAKAKTISDGDSASGKPLPLPKPCHANHNTSVQNRVVHIMPT